MKQGNPMSPRLCNAFVDMVLSEVDGSIRTTGDAESKVKCNYIAFADDLLSTTDVGMQMILMQIEGAMAKVG